MPVKLVIGRPFSVEHGFCQMKTIAMVLLGLSFAGSASANEIYVLQNAEGQSISTDTPPVLPAKKLDIYNAGPKHAKAAKLGSMTPGQEAAPTIQDDSAKRCINARQQYELLMTSAKIYTTGPEGERTYLTTDETNLARASSKSLMDRLCAGQ